MQIICLLMRQFSFYTINLGNDHFRLHQARQQKLEQLICSTLNINFLFVIELFLTELFINLMKTNTCTLDNNKKYM